METLVIAAVLFVEYRLECGGRVWAWGVTDRQTSTGFVFFARCPGVLEVAF